MIRGCVLRGDGDCPAGQASHRRDIDEMRIMGGDSR